MENLEEMFKAVEVYFSIYFDLFLDIQTVFDKYLMKVFLDFSEITLFFSPQYFVQWILLFTKGQ